MPEIAKLVPIRQLAERDLCLLLAMTDKYMAIPRITNNQKGVVLLLTLFILSSILVVTLGAAGLVFAGITMNRLTGYSSLAFSASEAGLERALWEARKNGYALPDEDTNNILCPSAPALCVLANGSSYRLDYATSTPFVTFKSIGSFSGAKRLVESTYEVE